MKILFNTYSTAFQSPGGGEVIIVMLKKWLEKSGHEVDLFNKWEHKIIDYDVVHEFSLHNWRDWEIYKAYDKPFVLTPTSWERDNLLFKLKYHFKENFKIALSKNRSYRSLKNAIFLPDIICPTTSLEGKRLVNFYSEDLKSKIKVIHNGVELHRNDDKRVREFREYYEVKDEFLIYVGSLRRNKNVEIAISMANSVNMKLMIIGSESYGDKEYADELRKYSSEKIIFIGALQSASNLLMGAMEAAEAILIPSDFETCSLVGLEAGSFGTNVLITKYGGTKEIFKDKAIYIDPLNKQQCMDSMNLLTSSKNEELKNFIHKNYSWKNIASQYENIYHEILK